MKRKVLYVIGQLGIGGSERQLNMTVQYMRSQGHHVEVAVWSYVPDDLYVGRLRKAGVLVHPLGRMPAQKVHALRQLVRELEPDLVHCFSFFLNATVALACLGRPCVVVGSSRAELSREVQLLGRRRAMLNATFPRAHVFNSQAAMAQADQVLPMRHPPKRWFVPNGLDLQRFAPAPLPDATPAIILGVGSLIPVKRWERLILAAAELRSQPVPFRVRILGKGPLYEPLRNLIRCKSLSDIVELAGTTSDVVSQVQAATIVAHASESEGSPNAVLEAMACARPVVAYPAGETPFLIQSGINGLLVNDDTPSALASALATLLSDPSACRRMGLAGRQLIEAGYSTQASGSAMLSAYRSAGFEG